MVIVVCIDDPTLLNVAYASCVSNNPAFGVYYQVFNDEIPHPNQFEDVFLLAHGAYGTDTRSAEIGDKYSDFCLTALQTADFLDAILPEHFSGGIYIDACHGADPAELNFCNALYSIFVARRKRRLRFYGRTGEGGGLIPPPGPSWKQVPSTEPLRHTENQEMEIEAMSVDSIRIVSAVWGMPAGYANVTDTVQDYVNEGNTSIECVNSILGNPLEGTYKVFQVVYFYNGQRKCGTCNQDNTFTF